MESMIWELIVWSPPLLLLSDCCFFFRLFLLFGGAVFFRHFDMSSEGRRWHASSTWLIHRSHDSFAVLLEAEEKGTPLSSALPYLRHKFQVQSISLGRQQGVFRLHIYIYSIIGY